MARTAVGNDLTLSHYEVLDVVAAQSTTLHFITTAMIA
jgi:hypothetical protein